MDGCIYNLKKLFLLLVFYSSGNTVYSQYTYGTTGLLNMPTAEMQRDKTFIFGGSFLEKHTTPARWTYDTFNYYINMTFFPWLEVAYVCTLHKALENDPAYGVGFWVPSTYGKFVNQDRNFAVRLRLWKEGWGRAWTPQIVIGINDFANGKWNGGDGGIGGGVTSKTNSFYNRYYWAMTKHLLLTYIGELGIHVAYVFNHRTDYPLNGPAIGVKFRFQLSGNQPLTKAINKLNLMAEYDSRTVNCGLLYSFWRDYINAVIEFNRCRYFSGGIIFKVHLK